MSIVKPDPAAYYDGLYRLASADNPGVDDEAYTYDEVGNRLTSATYNDWQYNGNNELSAYDGVSYQYDNNGNIIQKSDVAGVVNYVYDINNRLVRVEDGTGSVIAEYYYDPFGRRLWKEVGGQRTYFHYSDEGLVGEYDATGSEIKTYGYKPDSTWTTDPLFMKQGGEYYFYHNDHLGTPMIMTDISGNIVWSALYDSFGKAQVNISVVENNLRFPGQYYDSETGLHYNWNRYYEPNTGRYLTTDPIGFFGGDLNLYAYTGNNPVNFRDPWGLLSFDENLQRRRDINSGWASKGAKSFAGFIVGKGILRHLSKSGLGVTIGDIIRNRGAIATLGIAGTMVNFVATTVIKSVLIGATFYVGTEIGNYYGAYVDTLVDDGLISESIWFGSGIRNTADPCEK